MCHCCLNSAFTQEARRVPLLCQQCISKRSPRCATVVSTVLSLKTLLLLVLLAAPALAESVTYVLTPRFDRHVLDVELTWRTGQRTRSAMSVAPRFGPIRNTEGIIKNLTVRGASVQRDDSAWHFKHNPGATIEVRYTVDPEFRKFDEWRLTHVPITDDKFFHGIGSAFLLVPREAYGAPPDYDFVVQWKLPAGQQAVCSWGPGRHIGAHLAANDVRDSVYFAGDIELETIENRGREVTVALVNRFNFTRKRFAEMATGILNAECDFVGETAFPDFVITAIPVGDSIRPGESRIAGIGLYNSFALMLAPNSQLTDGVELLFAHEVFHYWNGRILPAAQPDRVVYWFVEGFTEYYALRSLYESGYWDAATFAKWLNRHLARYAVNPARNATNDDINRRFWTDRETYGEVAYQRGVLLGLRWNALAKKHGVVDGIDGLFRKLVARGRVSSFEISNEAFRKYAVEELGEWIGPEFDRYVIRADTIEVPTDALTPKFTARVGHVKDREQTRDVIQFAPAVKR